MLPPSVVTHTWPPPKAPAKTAITVFESPGSTAIACTAQRLAQWRRAIGPSHAAVGGAHDVDRLRAGRIGYPRPKDGGIRWVERDVEYLVVESDTEVVCAPGKTAIGTLPRRYQWCRYTHCRRLQTRCRRRWYQLKAGTSDHVLPPSLER